QGDAEAVPVLMQLLADPEVEVRILAAQGLKRAAGTPSASLAVPRLLEALATEEDTEIRFVLEDTLKAIDSDAAERAGLQVHRPAGSRSGRGGLLRTHRGARPSPVVLHQAAGPARRARPSAGCAFGECHLRGRSGIASGATGQQTRGANEKSRRCSFGVAQSPEKPTTGQL